MNSGKTRRYASYIRYSDAIEILQPDEADLIDKVVASMAEGAERCATNTAMRSAMRTPRAMAF